MGRVHKQKLRDRLAFVAGDFQAGEKVVRPGRFELPTFWFVAKRSIQLSYGRLGVQMRSE